MEDMSELIEIANSLTEAVNLDTAPLFIYGSDTIPSGAVSAVGINRCIAKTIFQLARDDEYDVIYLEKDEEMEICPGGQAWLGFKDFMSNLHYFISTGKEDFRNGAAEYLIANPELALKRLKSVGEIKPPAKYIIIQKNRLNDINAEILSIIIFGKAEQIRNLSSLYYFSSENSFDVQFPWGPYCASFVSYPSNMIQNSPHNSIILGPTDPTGNKWFPSEYLSMGIPYEIATQMATDLEKSFLSKSNLRKEKRKT